MNREEYVERMKRSVQFQHFGIEPVWVPEMEDIDGFIHDEVVRQFHDPRVNDDGGVRCQWMRAAWDFARNRARNGTPTPEEIETLGRLVEPHQNHGGFRDGAVYIGDGEAAPPELIPQMVSFLSTKAITLQRRLEHTGPHALAYRALWKFHVLSPGDIMSGFVENLMRADTVDDWYLAYEAVHPFFDGNGRTGKILHNWLYGTLDDPVLVADYFGGGNP